MSKKQYFDAVLGDVEDMLERMSADVIGQVEPHHITRARLMEYCQRNGKKISRQKVITIIAARVEAGELEYVGERMEGRVRHKCWVDVRPQRAKKRK